MKESFIKLVKDRKQEKDKQFSKELKNKKKNKNDTISNITQKKSGHEVEKINEAFEFKEKNLSKIETKHRESEGKTVIELKQEVNSLKDDLKDLKVNS